MFSLDSVPVLLANNNYHKESNGSGVTSSNHNNNTNSGSLQALQCSSAPSNIFRDEDLVNDEEFETVCSLMEELERNRLQCQNNPSEFHLNNT